MKRKIIPYNPRLKKLAKQLRENMTMAEAVLWRGLRNKQIMGYDFDRQRPVDEYIVDFYCKDIQLVIEVDGISHYNQEAWEADQKRQSRLENLGITFLRFDEQDVWHNCDAVLAEIEDWLTNNKPTPGPSQEGSAEIEARH